MLKSRAGDRISGPCNSQGSGAPHAIDYRGLISHQSPFLINFGALTKPLSSFFFLFFAFFCALQTFWGPPLTHHDPFWGSVKN